MLGFLQRHRQRLARLVLVVGFLLGAIFLWPQLPKDTDLEFALGPQHAEVIELRVAYVHEGEEMHGVSFGFPAGAPDLVHHTVSLPAGDFEVRCELRRRGGGSTFLVRRLRTPAEAVVRVVLSESGRGETSSAARPTQPQQVPS